MSAVSVAAAPPELWLTGQRGFQPLGLLLRALTAWLPAPALIVASGLAHGPVESFLRQRHRHRLHRFLPQLDARVSAIGRAERRADASVVGRVLLCEHDADVQASPSRAVLSMLGLAPPPAHKQRRLDTLFGNHVSPGQPVAAIAIDEGPERALQILRGSARTLAGDRPLVLTAIASDEASQHCMRLLRAARYRLLDAALGAHSPAPIDTSPFSLLGGWLLAVPEERALQDLAALLWDIPAPTLQDDEAWNAWRCEALQREAWRGGVRFEGGPSSGSLELTIDNELASWGFHPIEGEAGNSWAWIGPRPAAGFMLPGPDLPLHSIRLVCASAASELNRVGLVARLNGQAARVTADWSQGFGIIDIVPLRTRSQRLPVHCLELSLPEVRRASVEDPRLLALSVSSVSLSTTRP